MSGKDLIQVRQDTAAGWLSTNPVLAQGEPGIETDTGFMKFGDDATAWDSLPYLRNPEEIHNDATASAFTLAAGNMVHGAITRLTDAGAVAVTIETEATLGWSVPDGTVFGVRAAGAGGVSSWTTAGLTINGTLPTLSQHEEVWLRRVAQDEYDVVQ